jgi:hypothetical protein
MRNSSLEALITVTLPANLNSARNALFVLGEYDVDRSHKAFDRKNFERVVILLAVE